jgi:hypothetical protein
MEDNSFTSIVYELATEILEHRKNISQKFYINYIKNLFLKKYYELRNQHS